MFTRGQNNAPNNVDMVFDQFVNVARQRNSGVDVELNLRQDLGNAGRPSFTARMTYQTKDDYQLLPTSPKTLDNGESGSPKDRKISLLKSSHQRAYRKTSSQYKQTKDPS